MKIKKILVLLLTAVCLCTGFSMSAYAETVSSIGSPAAPAYEVPGNTIAQLSVTGTTATCKSHAMGIDIVSITVVQTLQKYRVFGIWTTHDGTSWTSTVNSNRIYVSKTKSGLSSGKYRLKSEFTLTDSAGKTEKITTYSSEVQVG